MPEKVQRNRWSRSASLTFVLDPAVKMFLSFKKQIAPRQIDRPVRIFGTTLTQLSSAFVSGYKMSTGGSSARN